MIEPNKVGAKFEMRWDGETWQVLINGFNFIDVNGIGGVGKEISQLVLRVFEGEAHRGDVVVNKPRFRGNV